MVHLCRVGTQRSSAQLIALVLRHVTKQYAPSPPKEACHQDPAPAAADRVCVAQTMCLAVRAPPPDPGPQLDEVLFLPLQAHFPMCMGCGIDNSNEHVHQDLPLNLESFFLCKASSPQTLQLACFIHQPS